MIKKILWLLTVLLGFVWFSFWYTVVGNWWQMEVVPPDTAVIGSYVYIFNNNWNISTDNYWQYLIWYNKDGSNNYNYIYWRIDWNLYFVWTYQNNVQKQWYVEKFSVCSEWEVTQSNKCLDLSITATDFYNLNPNITKVIVWNPWWSSLQNTTAWNYPVRLCYYNSNDSQYYCVQNAIWTQWYVDNPLINSLWFTNINSLSNWNRWSTPFSPFNSTPSIPDYEFNENDDFTNKQIIDGYNSMWLTDEFCYWWFALDNIFEAWTVPEMFTWYRWWGWASIFDIWNIYSWAYNNDYISFLRSFYVSYVNNNYSDFYWKTKALYWFINQWFSVSSRWLGFIESTAPTFTLVDVWQYCDLRFNQNPNAIYTWDRWDPKYRYYTSWQVNLWGYFNFSWNNNYFSWNLSWFNTPKDFFASLNSIFQWWLNNLENREPVLPTYIIIFFLAIIFIRIISH